VHDLGSAIHPFGYVSPYFRSLPLEEHGLGWIHPPAPLAHPFDDGTAAMLERSTEATGTTLGPDAEACTVRSWTPLSWTPWSRTPGR
jgi:phytoene dehydrogenase-like protein